MMAILSLLPILSLLGLLIIVKTSVAKAGGVSLVIALAIALGFFGLPAFGLSVALGKALWLGLFVSLIVWGALFLYHLVSGFGAIDVINKNIMIFVKDKFVAFLLLAWLFTGLLQGIAGFGVPIVIVTPILIALGFNPVKSLTATLLGHSWAVTFGSMGVAFFVIQGLTGVPKADLGVPMWIFATIAHFLTGIGVCWLHDGFSGIKKGLAYVLPVSFVMALVQYFTLTSGMYALATLNTALAGLAVMFLLYRLRAKGKEGKIKNSFYRDKLSLWQAVFPYALILVLLLLFQLIPAAVKDSIAVSPNFRGFETALPYPYTHTVAGVVNYSPIRLFAHPVFVLLIAAAVSCLIYRRVGIWDAGVFRGALQKTVKKGVPATLALLALGCMSLVMMESGMTRRFAYTVADLTGSLFPLFSPFFGVLASFLTGNNTNANILFGKFQYAIAYRLQISTAMMTASQSLSASVGVAIGPTLILMGALASDQIGQESVILKKLIPPVLVIALAMGVINYILLAV
ncbi:MAG: L-lactate permease [Chitinispirillales bacterium]|jgi:lactate permease|nr:L-lactate permease [Chitinispirillales bacterium]